MSIRDDLAELLDPWVTTWTTDVADGPGARPQPSMRAKTGEELADAVLDWLMSADKPWVLGSEPHMDGSHTVSVAKYHDGRPGAVTVVVPAGYVLAKVWP